jgi:hypothetical protein
MSAACNGENPQWVRDIPDEFDYFYSRKNHNLFGSTWNSPLGMVFTRLGDIYIRYGINPGALCSPLYKQSTNSQT